MAYYSYDMLWVWIVPESMTCNYESSTTQITHAHFMTMI